MFNVVKRALFGGALGLVLLYVQTSGKDIGREQNSEPVDDRYVAISGDVSLKQV